MSNLLMKSSAKEFIALNINIGVVPNNFPRTFQSKCHDNSLRLHETFAFIMRGITGHFPRKSVQLRSCLSLHEKSCNYERTKGRKMNNSIFLQELGSAIFC